MLKKIPEKFKDKLQEVRIKEMEKEDRNISVSRAAIIDALNEFTKRTGRVLGDEERFVVVFNNFALLLQRKGNAIFSEVYLDPIQIDKTYDFDIGHDEEVEVTGSLAEQTKKGDESCLS